jgi:hypothetical protein
MEVGAVAVIIGAPILSTWYNFAIVENLLVRLLLVAVIIYAISLRPIAGLLTFLAVLTLLLERNHALILSLPNQKPVLHDTNMKSLKAPAVAPVVQSQNASKGLANDVDLEDNIPDLEQAPSSHDAPNFFKGLLSQNN